MLYDPNGTEIRRPRKDLFPVLGAITARPKAVCGCDAEPKTVHVEALYTSL